MNVMGDVLLTQSTTYKITVGNDDAKVSVIIDPKSQQITINDNKPQQKRTRDRPCKHLNLPGRVQNAILVGRLLNVLQNIRKLGRKQVEGCYNGSIGAQFVLFHDVLVFYSVPDVDVGEVRQLQAGGVQVDDVGLLVVRGQSCDQGRFTGACHAQHYEADGLFRLLGLRRTGVFHRNFRGPR